MALMRRVKPIDIVEVRRLYEQTNLPVDHIAAMHGMCRNALYRRVHKWGWRMRRPTIELHDPPRGPDEVSPTAGSAAGEMFDIAATAARIHRAIACELEAIETVIAQLTPGAGEEAERAARVLASLTRTLLEVARLDLRGIRGASSEDENDRGPADPAEFVAELVRRMDEFSGRAQAAIPDLAAAGDA
jgi:hypothetical protein